MNDGNESLSCKTFDQTIPLGDDVIARPQLFYHQAAFLLNETTWNDLQRGDGLLHQLAWGLLPSLVVTLMVLLVGELFGSTNTMPQWLAWLTLALIASVLLFLDRKYLSPRAAAAKKIQYFFNENEATYTAHRNH